MKKLIGIILLFTLISCSNGRDVINHYQRAGVMPHGTNKKLNKYEQKRKKNQRKARYCYQ
jgi:hypothetical protein